MFMLKDTDWCIDYFVPALGTKPCYFPALSLVISNLWSCRDNPQTR